MSRSLVAAACFALAACGVTEPDGPSDPILYELVAVNQEPLPYTIVDELTFEAGSLTLYPDQSCERTLVAIVRDESGVDDRQEDTWTCEWSRDVAGLHIQFEWPMWVPDLGGHVSIVGEVVRIEFTLPIQCVRAPCLNGWVEDYVRVAS